MNRLIQWLLAALIVIAAAAVAAAVYGVALRGTAGEQDEDQQAAVQAASRTSVQNGRSVVTMDAQAQAREGIRVAPVAETSMRAEVRGMAIVLPVTDLASIRNAYVAARSRLERDDVGVTLSRTRYDRARSLYEQDQNVSLAAMQDAEAAYRTSQAQKQADEQDATLQIDTVRLRWGAVLADWTVKGDPALDAILEQRALLVQVAFPPGEVAKAPSTLSLSLPGNQRVPARLVSSMPEVNTQIQGLSYAYVAPARPGLAVGMNVPVLVPVGEPVGGALVPDGAVVWWQGQAWVYEAVSPTAFTRRPLAPDHRVEGGYFVPGRAFPAGTRLAVAGAQLLLSEEFRGQIQQEG